MNAMFFTSTPPQMMMAPAACVTNTMMIKVPAARVHRSIE
jgi:hypothetical protein